MKNPLLERVGILAVLFAYLAWLLCTAFSDPRLIHFADDIGLSFGVANAMLQGDIPLVGQPSHFGGRHLGPFYYWFLSGVMYLVGHTPGAIVFALGVFKAVAIVSLIYFSSTISRSNRKFLTTLGTLLFLGFSSGIVICVQTPWVNHFLILPSSALLVSIWLCVRYGWQWLGFYFLCATLCLQTFFGTAPHLLCLTIALLFYLFKNRRLYADQDSRRFGLWLFTAIYSWLPSVLYELKYDNNLGKLFGRHSSGSMSLDFSVVFEAFSLFVARHSGGSLIEKLMGQSVASIIAFIVFLSLIYLTARAADKYVRAYLLILVVGCLSTYLSVVAAPGPPLGFYFNMLIPSVIVISVLCLGYIIGHFSWRYASIAVFTFLMFISFSNLKDIHLHLAWDYQQRSLKHALSLSQTIDKLDQDVKPIRLFLRGKHYKRRSAVWYIYEPSAAYNMAYAPFFKELDLFRTVPGNLILVPKDRLKEAKLAFLEVCGPKVMQSEPKVPVRLSTHWKMAFEVSPYDCSTCKECRLFQLEKNGSSHELT